MSKLSVVVITKNEEKNVRDCLDSVSWADEIIVVDAGSTDRTVDIVKEYSKKVFSRPWDGYGAAKNFGIAQCSGEWVLSIDADERITPELRDEILGNIENDNIKISAFSVPRRANFMGKWIYRCGWYPGRITRVFRRSKGRFTEEKVHERLEIEGIVVSLKSDLLHYTDPDLKSYFNKFNKYTSLAAEELMDRGKKFSLIKLIANPVWIFFRMYILKRGFLDGIPGFILCVLSANYVFTKYAKLWEHSKQKEGGNR
ncbi:MAG: glycosyltransferase family 2 protein [Bacteroidetes bacterium]|nr:glycosyltransferase family 2 protein [Bacteroidota bacterium]